MHGTYDKSTWTHFEDVNFQENGRSSPIHVMSLTLYVLIDGSVGSGGGGGSNSLLTELGTCMAIFSSHSIIFPPG